MLQLKNTSKSFGSHQVFSIDELRLPGGIYRLKGVNGSGKSTFLNMLAGLLPFKGDIILNDTISIRDKPVAYRRYINHAPAEPLYPSFATGESLVAFVRAVKKGNEEQVQQIRTALDIGHYLANPTGSYSSGMLKKLSLLMAFTGQPAWILLDEPFTTLDQSSQQALAGLIRSYHEKGVSFMITSHHDMDTMDIGFSCQFSFRDKQLRED